MIQVTFRQWIKKNPKKIFDIWYDEVILKVTPSYEDDFPKDKWLKWRLSSDYKLDSFESDLILDVAKSSPEDCEKSLYWSITKEAVKAYVYYLGPKNKALALTDPMTNVREIASKIH